MAYDAHGRHAMSFWRDHFELVYATDCPELSGRILDFGCGYGVMDVMLARNGKTIHGIDLSPARIEFAKGLRDKEPEDVRNRLSFDVADVTVGSGAFDSVWASHVFEHIEDPRPVFDGLKRWTVPKANILISVPIMRGYEDPGHVHHWNGGKGVRRYFSQYMDILRSEESKELKVVRITGVL